jgi:hypothetical protein
VKTRVGNKVAQAGFESLKCIENGAKEYLPKLRKKHPPGMTLLTLFVTLLSFGTIFGLTVVAH